MDDVSMMAGGRRMGRTMQTATEIAMRRRIEDEPVVVEQLRRMDQYGDIVRVRFGAAGSEFSVDINMGRSLLTAGIRPAAIESCVRDSITAAVAGSVAEHITRKVMDVYIQRGRFDNTANLRNTHDAQEHSWRLAEEMERAIELRRMQTMEVGNGSNNVPPITSQEIRENVRRSLESLGAYQVITEGLAYSYGIDHALSGRADQTAFWGKSTKNTPQRKAWILLRKTIGKSMYRQLEKQGYFEVQGNRGLYRFHKNKQGGVTFLETRKYGDREVTVEFDLCIQSSAPDLPEGDVIVSRYLAWKADEEQFLQTANFRRVHCSDEAWIRR